MLLPCLFNERFPCSNIYLCVNLCRPKEQLVNSTRAFEKPESKKFESDDWPKHEKWLLMIGKVDDY